MKSKEVLEKVVTRATLIRNDNLVLLALANKIKILDFMTIEQYKEILKRFSFELIDAAENHNKDVIFTAIQANKVLDHLFVEDDETFNGIKDWLLEEEE